MSATATSALTAPTGRRADRTYLLRTSGREPLVAADHWVDVPLDHTDPGAPQRVQVYLREVRDPSKADQDQPYLLFLQGGPGGRGPRPHELPGWLDWALPRYRVLLLDQRGTGRSTPQHRHSLAPLGDAAAQADHLAMFRADAIVADAEAVRRALLGDEPWTTLGQSYGGFCTFTYASFAPEGLRECYVTGGVPPIGVGAEDLYRTTYRRVAARTADLDGTHPEVRAGLRRVAEHLERTAEHLPTGEHLTPQRLQELGHVLGQENGPDRLAVLVEDAWAGDRLSDVFLAEVASIVSYAPGPLYALMHESIYCDPGQASQWAADRVRAEQPWLEAWRGGDERLGLTGEMVHRASVAADPVLAPLLDTADALAERVWDRPLYDVERLSRSQVPIACAVYERDMYVDAGLSHDVTARVPGARVVDVPVLHHDALRRHGPEVLGLLDRALGHEPDRGGAT